MKFAIVIPARYKSSRFPGKPLVDICDRPMILRVWDKARQALPEDCVYIATDDERIANICKQAGANVLMTPEDCLTGTDRVFHASQVLDTDILINIQGDEPLILVDDILAVINESKAHPSEIINAMCPIQHEEEFYSSSVPKVVCTPQNRLLYMSRAAIPTTKGLSFDRAYKQVCIYAFPKESLETFAKQPQKTPLEQIEDIEILRFLELGYNVRMLEVSESSIAVDHPEDVTKVEKALRDAI